MGYAEQLEAIYAKWERRIEERGIEKGIRTALVNVYQARFGALPAALRPVIDATQDAPTLQRWTALFSTATADEIAAALLPAHARPAEPRRANKTGKARRDPGHAPARKRISRSPRPSE